MPILRARSERERLTMERSRMLNYELAGLIAYAFNDPGKMPKYKPFETQPADPKPTEADHARLRAYFIRLSQQGQK